MLQKIAKLDAAVLKALLLVIVGFIAQVASIFGLFDAEVFKGKAEDLVEAISVLLIGLGAFWAWYARVYQPTPPLSDIAVQKTQEMVQQGKLKTVNQ
jgi:hypothetical protein